jgi:UDP-N-acetylglucosamine kinase
MRILKTSTLNHPLKRACSLTETLSVKQITNLRKNTSANETKSALDLRQRQVTGDSRYLNEPTNKSELLERVKKELCQDVTSQENPSAFVITGQMGAGKSTATKTCSKQFSDNCVVVDYDDLKKYIPGYSELARSGHPDTVPNCQQTALFLCEGLIKHALRNKFNMVIQRSMLDQQHSISDVLTDCKNSGLKTNLKVLAVDKSLSRIGIFTRYESALKQIYEGKAVPDGARRTPLDKHDEAYRDMENVEKFKELLPLLDTVTVTSRSGEEFYIGTKPDEIVEALQKGRLASKNDNNSRLESFNILAELVKSNVQSSNYNYY